MIANIGGVWQPACVECPSYNMSIVWTFWVLEKNTPRESNLQNTLDPQCASSQILQGETPEKKLDTKDSNKWLKQETST